MLVYNAATIKMLVVQRTTCKAFPHHVLCCVRYSVPSISNNSISNPSDGFHKTSWNLINHQNFRWMEICTPRHSSTRNELFQNCGTDILRTMVQKSKLNGISAEGRSKPYYYVQVIIGLVVITIVQQEGEKAIVIIQHSTMFRFDRYRAHSIV